MKMKENDVGIEFIGRQGFDAVYEKYKNLIFQTAFLYIKEWYAAEDIMQETFLRYYIYMEHTRVENTKSWLLTTAKNIALNYIRDNSRSTVLSMEDEEEAYMALGRAVRKSSLTSFGGEKCSWLLTRSWMHCIAGTGDGMTRSLSRIVWKSLRRRSLRVWI